MRWIATLLATVVATLTTMIPGVAASPITLTVRLYNTAAVPAAELLAARETAEAILGGTGLNVVFRHCGGLASAGDPIDPCNESLTPSEVVVRLINAPAFNTTLHPDAFGLAYVVAGTDRGWLATVFPDRITQAAARAAVPAATLIGRVMAHEVGHLLLGNRYHGDAGVMRADWPDRLLHRTADEWRFSMTEAARIQRLLVAMNRSRRRRQFRRDVGRPQHQGAVRTH
jgi:hypothetical protein